MASLNRGLEQWILDKIVEIEGYGLDPNIWFLDAIFVDDKNVSLELVREGLAEVHREGSMQSPIAKQRRRLSRLGEGCGPCVISIFRRGIGERYTENR